jgi:hydrogenase maturation factor
MEMEITDKKLFLKYTAPCSYLLAKRNIITGDYSDEIIRNASMGRELGNAERLFKTAYAMCMVTAKKMKKSKIDSDVIREYFWYNHDEAVEWEHEHMKDFDPERCKIYAGRISKIYNGTADVVIESKHGQYKTDFDRTVKNGDYVVVHMDFIVEKIDEESMERINNSRKR